MVSYIYIIKKLGFLLSYVFEIYSMLTMANHNYSIHLVLDK